MSRTLSFKLNQVINIKNSKLGLENPDEVNKFKITDISQVPIEECEIGNYLRKYTLEPLNPKDDKKSNYSFTYQDLLFLTDLQDYLKVNTLINYRIDVGTGCPVECTTGLDEKYSAIKHPFEITYVFEDNAELIRSLDTRIQYWRETAIDFDLYILSNERLIFKKYLTYRNAIAIAMSLNNNFNNNPYQAIQQVLQPQNCYYNNYNNIAPRFNNVVSIINNGYF